VYLRVDVQAAAKDGVDIGHDTRVVTQRARTEGAAADLQGKRCHVVSGHWALGAGRHMARWALCEPVGQVRSGQVRSGQVRSGRVRSGGVARHARTRPSSEMVMSWAKGSLGVTKTIVAETMLLGEWGLKTERP
jgi:hypothetical protein